MGTLKANFYKRIEQLEDIDKVVELQAEIWSPDIVSPKPQLLASVHNGGIVIGAYDGEKLVGFCYGFPGYKDGEAYLVSHMTGILPGYQNSGIGYQLKLQQREWAINFGYKKIVWTFDPLEIRNGYFNFCKLGAYSKRYIPSYYGELKDKLNQGLPSDRLLVEWEISRPLEDSIFSFEKYQPNTKYELLLNWNQEDEYPTPEPLEIRLEQNQHGFRVPVPSNIQFIKKHNTDLAQLWRYALRTTITKALLSGYTITNVDKESSSIVHFYILEKLIVDG